MIGRRTKPDGLPFRLYERVGKFKISYFYKLPGGANAFWLSASVKRPEAIAQIRREAIQRAEILNGKAVSSGTTEELFKKYFAWQERMPIESEDRKAKITLTENKVESKNLIAVFGAMDPEHIKPKDIYRYLSERANRGAPAKANKEIALLSAVLEYARRLGVLEKNPCRGIKYNRTKPSQKYVTPDEIELMLKVARARGGSYLVFSLCMYTAYLTVSRPSEMRELTRKACTPDGLEIEVGKRRAGQARKTKLILWSPELKATVDEAIALQRTPAIYIFANSTGQVYSRTGWTTILNRLMKYCEDEAKQHGAVFNRFTLKDMRPTAVTDRMTGGDQSITDATGHVDERMVKKVYDRRTVKKAKATNTFGQRGKEPRIRVGLKGNFIPRKSPK